MSLKEQLPSFEKGSADLGGQLRDLLAVVVKLCESVEGTPPADKPDEAPAAEQPADEAPAEPVKPATKPVAKAAAAK
ncbi:hypothetical protein CQ020_03780 [Arthrobacter sp. MYb23]|uniref:hypothetical protein n=1 Tax=unclassified Arthrobacter TaxID=235627 RepID=UPI000CFD7A20|nr:MULTISPECIES: hypothetical protein [unclassified Arthrobacter]PRB44339.1 hypothetical protein CQ038_03635 [Arthrobacter sp. MYb51]PRB98591.1 hypothetical protein CQ020_03780 [Arthrobacter sp. MYb23]